MRTISDRLAKLEAKIPTIPARRVERHIVYGANDAERQAQIAANIASTGNVLHICRTIVSPDEPRTTLQ